MLNNDLDIQEIYKALNKMGNNKSPEPDGIIVAFYKYFWNIIKQDLIEIYKYGFDYGTLSYTQYMELIILLYKKAYVKC